MIIGASLNQWKDFLSVKNAVEIRKPLQQAMISDAL